MAFTFYGDENQAKVLAGDASAKVTAEVEQFVNEYINLTIKQDGFAASTATQIDILDVKQPYTRQVLLTKIPVVNVTEVLDAYDTDSENELTSDSYTIDKETGILTLLDVSQFDFEVGKDILYFTEGLKMVSVTYTHGYSAIPSDIKQIATLLAAKQAIIMHMRGTSNGLKAEKIGDYQRTFDVSAASVKTEFDDMLDTMLKAARGKYHVGV